MLPSSVAYGHSTQHTSLSELVESYDIFFVCGSRCASVMPNHVFLPLVAWVV